MPHRTAMLMMAYNTIVDKYAKDPDLFRHRYCNRQAIDALIILAVGAYENVDTATETMYDGHDILLNRILDRNTFMSSPVWLSRMREILYGERAYQFNDVAALVNAMYRACQIADLEQLVLHGLLFRIFDIRNPEIMSPNMSYVQTLVRDITVRARMQGMMCYSLADMRHDNLNCKSSVIGLLRYLQQTIRSYDHVDNWAADAIQMCNALFLTIGISYILRATPYEFVQPYLQKNLLRHLIRVPGGRNVPNQSI
jgi:hypothetical protein